MKTKTITRLLCTFLTAVILCSSALFAFAAGSGFDGARAVTVGTVTVTDKEMLRFVPEATGYYSFKTTSQPGNCNDTNLTLYDADGIFISQTYSSGQPESFTIYEKLTAGTTYYISAYCYSDIPETFTAVIEYFGEITGVQVLSRPTATLYDGIGCDFYYSDGKKCVGLSFDTENLSVEVTFSGGKKITFLDYNVYSIFTSNDVLVSNNAAKAVFSAGGTEYFALDFTVLLNPISSLEIVSAPKKTDYVFGTDDGTLEYGSRFNECVFYPDIELDGLVIKINYRNGSSKTVTAADFETDEYGAVIAVVDGIELTISSPCCYSAGTEKVFFRFAEQSCFFTVRIKAPSFSTRLLMAYYSIFYNLMRFFGNQY